MKNLFLALTVAFLTGCVSMGGSVKFDDGTWSMCSFKNKEGFVLSVPLQTALPIGAEHPNGTVLKCEPIPKAPVEAE